MQHYRINPGNAALCANTRTVGRYHLTTASGITIPNVPGSVTRVVIIANYGEAPPLPTTGNITGNTLLGRTLYIENQYDAWSVNLTNCPTSQIRTGTPNERLNGNLYQRTPASGGNLALYATTIHLAPTVARFEIGEIAGGGNIQSFTIDGIFIDGFFRNARINSNIDEASLHTGGLNPANFTAASHAFDTNYGIHDWHGARNWTGSAATSLVVRPNNEQSNVYHPAITNPLDRWIIRNHVWAYQVFARHYNLAPVGNEGTPVPRIIIRFSNVRVIDGSPTGALWNNTGVAFLTVRDFRQDNGVLLPYIRASRVYHIPRIMFDETELDYIPNRLPIDVNVQVFLTAWRRVELGTII